MTGPQRQWPPSDDVLAEWAPWVPDPDRPGIWHAPLPGPDTWPGDCGAQHSRAVYVPDLPVIHTDRPLSTLTTGVTR